MIALAVTADIAHSATFRPWAVALGLALLVANGAFTATEISLLAARRTRIDDAGAAGDRRARWALRSLSDLPTAFSATQLGVTMSSLALGAVAEPALAALLLRATTGIGLADAAATAVAVGLALGVVVFLHMVVGDMAPKNLALARAESVALALARPFGWFVRVFRPVIALLDLSSRAVLALLRVEPVAERQLAHTPDELALVLTDSQRRGSIDARDARMMDAVLRLASIDAQAAMTPRTDVVAIADTASVDELLALASDSGFTRLPVFHGDLDAVVGLVHVKDALLSDATRVSDLLRGIVAVPETRDLERLLPDLLAERHHMVLVVDEFGGTAGVLTLEDVLEELVGDIDDEFDEPDAAQRVTPRTWEVPGTLRRDELERLTGLALDAESTETTSGWMMERLGRLVDVGDTVEHDGWTLTVRSLDGLRAGVVVVRAPRADTGR